MTLYEPDQLNEIAEGALKGRSQDEYVAKAIEVMKTFCQQRPDNWKAFGGYWAVVQKMLLSNFNQAKFWNDGELAPDFLKAYDYGSDFLNCVAALTFLNQNGDYQSDPNQPITIQDGDRQILYIPGVGEIE